MTWAVFLDRDGTVNKEVHYLHHPDELRLIPGAAEAIRLLNQAQVPAILVTNQSGIGRGRFPKSAMEAVHEELCRQLGSEGAHLDAIYFCPHRPDECCDCRKPAPGLLIQAAREGNLDLTRSVIVGDKHCDLEAGRRAGCRTGLVRTGYGAEVQQELATAGTPPNFVGADLLDVVRRILAASGPDR
jgi:histidinol-phosphate phosphatase family protein